MKLLERIGQPFRELMEWQEHQMPTDVAHAREVEEQWRTRHQAYLKELHHEFAHATYVPLQTYRRTYHGEARPGKMPAVEYFHTTAEVRIYNLLDPQLLEDAELTRALAMRLDTTPDHDADLIDVKPTEFAPIEHGAINLGPVLEFHCAEGARWRFFLEITYTTVRGAVRGGIETRHFVCDCTL